MFFGEVLVLWYCYWWPTFFRSCLFLNSLFGSIKSLRESMKSCPARQHKDYFLFLICSLSADNQLSINLFLQSKTLTKTLVLMLFTKHHKNKHRTFSFCLSLIVNPEKKCPYCPCLPSEFFATLCEISQTQDKYFHFCKDFPDWKTKTKQTNEQKTQTPQTNKQTTKNKHNMNKKKIAAHP